MKKKSSVKEVRRSEDCVKIQDMYTYGLNVKMSVMKSFTLTYRRNYTRVTENCTHSLQAMHN